MSETYTVCGKTVEILNCTKKTVTLGGHQFKILINVECISYRVVAVRMYLFSASMERRDDYNNL